MKIGGKEINNWYVVGGAAALVGGYVFWKHESNASAAAASSASPASSSAIDPVTGLPYSEDNSIDPETGLSYLSEAEEYGSVQAAEEMISSGSAYYGDTGDGDEIDSGDSGGSTSTTTGSTGTTYATNAQWASAVQAGLVGIGYSSESIASALGLFFAQHPLSSTQAGIIQVAEAEYGPPPQGTYSIISSPGGGGGTTGKPSVAVPNVIGMTVNQAQTKLTAAGLSVNTDIAKDKPGYDRKVTATNPKAGTSVTTGTHVGITWNYVKS